jgi:hypothetical protein
VPGTVIRVEVQHLPKPTSRTKKALWLWWSGPGEPDLDRCWRAYLHRFDIEHTFRFFKSTLGWTTPSLCTPEQADRWSWLIAAAYTQLRLARRLVEDLRLQWERHRQQGQLTPVRVRRGFRRLRATIGTPASPPKSTKPGPGRPKGTRKPPQKTLPGHQESRLNTIKRFNRKLSPRCRRGERASRRRADLRWAPGQSLLIDLFDLGGQLGGHLSGALQSAVPLSTTQRWR